MKTSEEARGIGFVCGRIRTGSSVKWCPVLEGAEGEDGDPLPVLAFLFINDPLVLFLLMLVCDDNH